VLKRGAMHLFAAVAIFILYSAVHIVIAVDDYNYVYDIENGKRVVITSPSQICVFTGRARRRARCERALKFKARPV